MLEPIVVVGPCIYGRDKCKDRTAWEAVCEGIQDLWGLRRSKVMYCARSGLDIC